MALQNFLISLNLLIKTAVTALTVVIKIGFGSSLFTPKSKCLMVIYILCFMYWFE